jgi:hypothetical protein
MFLLYLFVRRLVNVLTDLIRFLVCCIKTPKPMAPLTKMQSRSGQDMTSPHRLQFVYYILKGMVWGLHSSVAFAVPMVWREQEDHENMLLVF